MTAADLIDALGVANAGDDVIINIGGTQVEDFEVETGDGVVTLRGREDVNA